MDSAVDPASKVGFRELEAGDVAEVATLRDHVLARLRHPDDYVPHAEEDALMSACQSRYSMALPA